MAKIAIYKGSILLAIIDYNTVFKLDQSVNGIVVEVLITILIAVSTKNLFIWKLLRSM